MDRPGELSRARPPRVHTPPHPLGPLLAGGKLALLPLARRRRRRLRTTTFFAVTGSAGKTTTTRLLAAALAPLGPVAPLRGRRSQGLKVIETLLRVSPAHRSCVYELAAYGEGTLDEILWAYEPDVGVVLGVGDDHIGSLGTRDGVAAEKRKLVETLPPEGLAVLNADDPRVRGMAAVARCRVVLFGRAQEADFRAEEVGARFPDRLRLTLVHEGRRHPVRTRLCGELWLGAVLGGLAAAVSAGVPCEQAIRAIEAVEPVPSRLSVLEAPGDVVFLRDDFKAPAWSLPATLKVLGDARASRKIAVVGRLTDTRRKPRRVYAEALREARRHADLVLLVGQSPRHAMHALTAGAAEDVVVLESAPEAVDYLRASLRPGDLVLVKSVARGEHLERLSLSSVLEVACRRPSCRRRGRCDACPKLTVRGITRPSAGALR